MALNEHKFQALILHPRLCCSMIRMIQSQSPQQAKAYFSEALNKADYYIHDQELQGRFDGLLAERLGIVGPATKDVFFALAENRHPVTGERLTPRSKENRTTGYDINFHCPKSLSILHALAKDDHILKAFESAVYDTMKDIEADSQTRIRKKGVSLDRNTGSLVWAQFTHQTARPVEGYAPDPHLHAHCFVFNATWDAEEQTIKAAQFRDIKRHMPYYQARFHKRLSDRLAAGGYRIRRTATAFEIEGVPKAVIDYFSKRTNQIGQVAKEKNITNPKDLDALGARTRSAKQKGMSMDDLRSAWRDAIRALDIPEAEKAMAVRHASPPERSALTGQRCIDLTLQHCFERASVMEERRLLATAARFALGHDDVSLESVDQAFKHDPRLMAVKQKGRLFYTTKEVLAEERRMVQLAQAGRGQCTPLYAVVPPLPLSDEQRAAVAHVLTTPDRVSIVRGAAGTGKTTLMKTAITLMELKGKEVFVVAPTAEAAHGVLKSEGFKDPQTVARLLVDKDLQKRLTGQVLWVDEAGLLGTQDMVKLMEIATKQKARLILGGDTRQHASVVRGDALRILNTIGGIKTAEVSTIYRQKETAYREAVSALSKGDVNTAFQKLDELWAIRPINNAKPYGALVEHYIDSLKAGKSALIISPTHKEGDAVTQAVREGLRAKRMIGKKEIAALKLENRNLTEAERSDVRHYRTDSIIQFNQHVPGFKRGSVWRIARIEDNAVWVTGPTHETKPLPLDRAKRFDVFEASEIKLASRDKVRITRNGFDTHKKRLNNGMTMEVAQVKKDGAIKLRNLVSQVEYTVDKNFGHIAHAHCLTSYASQGKTVDRVLIAQPAATFPATDLKQFYVSVSRGRESVAIYTDDKELLMDYATEMGDRQSALELVKKRDTHLKHFDHLDKQREHNWTKEKDKAHDIFYERDYEPEP